MKSMFSAALSMAFAVQLGFVMSACASASARESRVFPHARSFREFDASFEGITRKISFQKAFTPANIAGARKRFKGELAKGHPTDPIFRYRDGAGPGLAMAGVLISIARAARELSMVSEALPPNPLPSLYLARLERLRAKASFLGRWAFWGRSGEPGGWNRIYPLFSCSSNHGGADPNSGEDSLVSAAQGILERAIAARNGAVDRPDPAFRGDWVTNSVPETKVATAANGRSGVLARAASHRETAAILEEFAASLGITGIRFAFRRNMAGRISVSPVSRRVSIRKGASFDLSARRRLAVHEIGTHLLRSQNGRRLTGGLAVLSLTIDTDTEEGLAKFMELATAAAEGENDLWMALRVLADFHGRQESFSRLFRRAEGWFRALGYRDERIFDSAWSIAFRAKRGLRDTSLHHTYPKDASYLRGFRKLTKIFGDPGDYLAGRGRRPHALDALLSGKWSVEEMDMAICSLDAAAKKGVRLMGLSDLSDSLKTMK